MFVNSEESQIIEEDLRDFQNWEWLEWYGMFEVVLIGDVVCQEKKCFIGLVDEEVGRSVYKVELWLVICVKICDRYLLV